MRPDVAAILVNGVYGAGKTTVVEELADLLEQAGEPYAAIDLDWLAWSNASGGGHEETDLLARNLRAVAGTYREAGARRFVVAGFVEAPALLAAIREALAMPVAVVWLSVPIEEIEHRLSGAPTRGRSDDLVVARDRLAAGAGRGLENHVIENTDAPRAAASRILELVGWVTAGEPGESAQAPAAHGPAFSVQERRRVD